MQLWIIVVALLIIWWLYTRESFSMRPKFGTFQLGSYDPSRYMSEMTRTP